jgi:hypothetical protein
VRLLVERVVVTGDHVAIEHAIPLSGRFCGVASTGSMPSAVPGATAGCACSRPSRTRRPCARSCRTSAYEPTPLYIPLRTEGSSVLVGARRARGGSGGRLVTCELVENPAREQVQELGAAGRDPLGLEGREEA